MPAVPRRLLLAVTGLIKQKPESAKFRGFIVNGICTSPLTLR